jgi:hypothetical protein
LGVTASTPANLVVGAGNVFVDGNTGGATADDNTFTINQTIFEPDNLNGVPGMLVGTQYKTREEAVLACSLPEVSGTVIELLWPGSDTTGELTSWNGTRRIPTASFHDYRLAVDGLTYTFHFLADNALNQGNIEYNGQDAGMMTPRGEFHSKWDAATLTASPHRIRIGDLGS